jgi:hypothetical protein
MCFDAHTLNYDTQLLGEVHQLVQGFLLSSTHFTQFIDAACPHSTINKVRKRNTEMRGWGTWLRSFTVGNVLSSHSTLGSVPASLPLFLVGGACHSPPRGPEAGSSLQRHKESQETARTQLLRFVHAPKHKAWGGGREREKKTGKRSFPKRLECTRK